MANGTQTIDYDALAKQAGAINSQPAQQSGNVDYAALAKQAGAVSSQPPKTPAQPETGIWAGVKRNTVGMVAGLYHAFADPATDQEKQDLLTKVQAENARGETVPEDLATNPSRATLAYHRLIDAPADVLSKKAGNEQAAAQDLLSKGQTWKGGNQYLSAATDKFLSAIPAAGPWLNSVAQRYESGDKLGAATDVASAVAYGNAPEIVRATKAAPAVADFFRSSAEKNYQDVLNPTKVTTKYQTQKIMPQLLEEKPTAWTRKGLAEKAAGQAEQAGQGIEQTVSGLQGTMNTQPVIDGLQNLKKSYQVNGVSLRPEVDNAIDAVSEQMQAMGPDISLQDAVKARRILDSAVAEAKGYQGAQLSDASMAAIRKETANSIRGELGKASPDLAALNSKFHFWNTLSDVMEQTIQRKTGQVNALPKMETVIAGAGGLAKAGVTGAAGAGSAMWLLGKAVRSTGWRTVKAATKSSIVDALGNGQFDRAVGLLGKTGIVGQALSQSEDSGEQGAAVPDETPSNQGPIASLLNYDPVQARQAFSNPVVQHALNTLNPGAANSVIRKYGVADTRKYFRGRNA
jgi:hypothetical protein